MEPCARRSCRCPGAGNERAVYQRDLSAGVRFDERRSEFMHLPGAGTSGPTDAQGSNDFSHWTTVNIYHSSNTLHAQPFTPTANTYYTLASVNYAWIEVLPDATWGSQSATANLRCSASIAWCSFPYVAADPTADSVRSWYRRNGGRLTESYDHSLPCGSSPSLTGTYPNTVTGFRRVEAHHQRQARRCSAFDARTRTQRIVGGWATIRLGVVHLARRDHARRILRTIQTLGGTAAPSPDNLTAVPTSFPTPVFPTPMPSPLGCGYKSLISDKATGRISHVGG